MIFTFDHLSSVSYLVTFYLALPFAVRSIQKILKYPPTWTLSGDERQLLWKFRFSLMSEKRALTKFLRCVEWSDVQVSTCTLLISVFQNEGNFISQAYMFWDVLVIWEILLFQIKVNIELAKEGFIWPFFLKKTLPLSRPLYHVNIRTITTFYTL